MRPAFRAPKAVLLGQLAGDSFGDFVEFRSAASIKSEYPAGVRELADGGHWGILAGQPTDDSEMALMLARVLIHAGKYDPAAALDAYLHWYDSPPFDIGGTTSSALAGAKRGRTAQERLDGAKGHANTASQANGSLMRASPLGIFGAGNPSAAADWCGADSRLTHSHQVCQGACAVFVAAIATAIAEEVRPRTAIKRPWTKPGRDPWQPRFPKHCSLRQPSGHPKTTRVTKAGC